MFGSKYLTYEEYTSLGGLQTETSFNLLEFEARVKIDKATFGRLKDLTEIDDEVKNCVFKLISILDENKSTIKSESVDGYSLTLTDRKDLEKTINGVIKDYLSNSYIEEEIPYLFRGVNDNE